MVNTSDPLNPRAGPSSQTFHTLKRERQFRHPPADSSDYPALDELVAPHIQSFNALTEDDTGMGKGLIGLGLEDIGEKVVFDGQAAEGYPFGTKITCEFTCAPRA